MYNDSTHKYYLDFYVKSTNTVYEVKSTYTYNNELNKNLLKQYACINKGLNFEFLIIPKLTYKNWQKTLNINII